MANHNRLGAYVKCSVTGESYQAFIPPALPPEPPLNLVPLQQLLTKASKANGKLDGVADVLPDSSLFLYYYVRKEAVLSSQIEGTQSSLSDLLLYESMESPSVPIDDVAEVSCYVAALEHGHLAVLDHEQAVALVALVADVRSGRDLARLHALAQQLQRVVIQRRKTLHLPQNGFQIRLRHRVSPLQDQAQTPLSTYGGDASISSRAPIAGDPASRLPRVPPGYA
jgi:hypothetical protein